MSPIERYVEQLRRQQAGLEGARLLEEPSLAIDGFRFFRRADRNREVRAGVSSAGVVTGAGGEGWWRLLGCDRVDAAAECLAWLLSTRGGDRAGRGRTTVVVRAEEPVPTPAIDPLVWRAAPAPRVRFGADTRELGVWLYTARAEGPVAWTVRASPVGAQVSERPARELVDVGDVTGRAVEAVAGDDLEATRWALLFLSLHPVTSSPPGLTRLLSHADAAVRGSAASALAACPTEDAVDALCAAARHETEAGAQTLQVQALGRLGTAAAARGLASVQARIADPWVRVEVIHALARLGASPEARAGLAEASRDADSEVSGLAAYHLERLGLGAVPRAELTGRYGG
jgi:hypothetical protein